MGFLPAPPQNWGLFFFVFAVPDTLPSVCMPDTAPDAYWGLSNQSLPSTGLFPLLPRVLKWLSGFWVCAVMFPGLS